MTNMKLLAREVLRWVIIVVTGGYGLWQLFETGRRAVGMQSSGDWSGLVVGFIVLLMPLLRAAPCLAVAYICLRRRYRKLFLVLGVVGCIVLFGELSALPGQLGLVEFMVRHAMSNG